MAAKRTIQGRRIAIRRFAAPDDYRPGCQMLFVSRSLTADQQALLLKKTQGNRCSSSADPGFRRKGRDNQFLSRRRPCPLRDQRRGRPGGTAHFDAKLLNLGKAVSCRARQPPASPSSPVAGNSARILSYSAPARKWGFLT